MTASIKKDCEKNIPFIISGFIVAFFLSFGPLTHDDLNLYSDFSKSATLMDIVNYVHGRFYTWSSRCIVEFFLLVFEKVPKPVWAITMGFFWLLLQWGISKLVAETPDLKLNIFVALLSLLFPFRILETAGWIATSFTYLTPITFGTISLLPLRYLYLNVEKEKITLPKAVIFSLLMMYACNLEQMSVALTFVMLVMVVFEIVKHNADAFHLWMLFIAASGLFFALVAPGNKARIITDTRRWFPTYSMLNFFDKAETGVTTAALWLMRLQNFFWFFVAIILFVAVFQKQKSNLCRAVGAIPFCISFLFTFGRTTLGRGVPFLFALTRGIPRNGLINPSTAFTRSNICEWILIGLFYISVILSILMVCEKKSEAIFWISLLFAGFGSRWMMGFSPTIYASRFRTSMILSIFLIMIGSFLYHRIYLKHRLILFSSMGLVAMINLGLWARLLGMQ